MKTLTTIIALSVFVLSATACSPKHGQYSGLFGGKTVKASKNYVTKNIKVDEFTGVSLAGSPDITYTQKAGKPEVEIYTSDNIIDLLDISVDNGMLTIKFKKGVNVSYNKLKIRISSATLNSISVAGSGNIELANGLKTDRLKMSVAGSGDIKANDIACTGCLSISIAGSGDIQGSNITCADFKTSVTGSGDMKLSNVSATATEASVAGSGTVILTGTTQEANYRVTGSGDLFASDLQAKRVSASVSGSGNIKCHATDFLKARTSGSGNIGYKGNPELDYPKKGLYKL
ncbi:head GIN domain-containing protein [Bacteroides gallinarum]|uniref:head GIN domain-containing protein n=1 Tax=Bacteroides gallinarum TaxID=376806 RepID=UPI00037FA5B9|nr:head GIN domain-containing protein [Bacteroides gallinarum]